MSAASKSEQKRLKIQAQSISKKRRVNLAAETLPKYDIPVRPLFENLVTVREEEEKYTGAIIIPDTINMINLIDRPATRHIQKSKAMCVITPSFRDNCSIPVHSNRTRDRTTWLTTLPDPPRPLSGLRIVVQQFFQS